MKTDLSRRHFMERLGACALGSAALSRVVGGPAKAQENASTLQGGSNANPWSAPQILDKPNILVIMVDQLRFPCWLTSGSNSQMATLDTTYMPNILGRIRDNSYNFQQYFVAATMCTPSRAALLTGLYAPETAMYETGESAPALNPAFPTWGQAIANLNPAYAGNVWWFGKWHLSDPGPTTPTSPLAQYDFNTRNFPGAGGPSPNGWPNEGLKGGVNQAPGSCQGVTYANDSMIAQDFIGWLNENPNLSNPWCATVSFVNPHDIGFAPGWFGSNPPRNMPVYFPTDFPNGMPPNPPPDGFSPSPSTPLCSAVPSPWNWENVINPSAGHYVSNKPSYQYTFLKSQLGLGQVSYPNGWVSFLNEYYWLQNFVDQQVGAVLDALNSNPEYAAKTIVIFTSDHGEYGGSHGLHGKGGGVYDESIHVPLYVHFPLQKGDTGSMGGIAMKQMCSSVDFFGLVCDLATAGNGQTGLWTSTYPDLASRQSIWSFLYYNSAETRMAVDLPGNPSYILHTVDETSSNEYCGSTGAIPPDNRHIVCLRTKYNPMCESPGAKLGVYSTWDPTSTHWDGATPQEYEFYDYNPATTNNQAEKGNDYTINPGSPTASNQNQPNAQTQAAIDAYVAALGELMSTELNPPLTGTGNDNNPLSDAQAAAQQAYYQYIQATNSCLA